MRQGTIGAAIVAISLTFAGQAIAASPKLSGRPLTPVVSAGDKVQVELMAKAGKAKTKRAQVGLLLSTDKKASKKDTRLGKAKLPALKPRKSKKVKVTGKLPAKAKPDGYSVLACPGKAKCKALAGTVGVNPKVTRVNVTLQTDDARAASAPVTRSGGGRVEATGADGTRYALILPPGSVPTDVTVRMTPLAGAQGLPFDGLAGGVKLEPAGLSLDEPAKLLMHRDGLAISPGTAGFGSSDGKDLFLTPWTTPPDGETLGEGTIAIGVTHFSGWGAVSLNQTQLGAQYARSAFQARDRIAQDARQAIEDSGTGFPDEAKVAQLEKDYTEQVVKPLLEAAAQDPAFLDDAVAAYLGLERQLQLLGKPEGLPDDPALAKLFKRAFMRYVQALKERCNQADFATIGEAVSLARQMQITAGVLPGINGPPQSLAEALELLDQCLRFELRMVSRQDFQNGFTVGVSVSSTVPLRLNEGELIGTAPLTYTSASYAESGCSTSTTTQDSTATVVGGADLRQLSPPGPGKPPVESPQASFVFDPGTPSEHIYVSCPEGGSHDGMTLFWVTLWAGCTHPQEFGFARTIEGFKATGTAGVLAEVDFNGSYACNEDLPPTQTQEHWELVHTPARG